MVFLGICWLGAGLVNLAMAYWWARRPFMLHDGVAFFVGGPVVLGSIFILFLGGHAFLRGIDIHPETGVSTESWSEAEHSPTSFFGSQVPSA